MARKTGVTAADLFVLIDREFRRRKPRDCAACFVQLPYLVDAPNGTNWELVSPPVCGHGCSEVLEELVREFQELYELKSASALD